MTPVEALKLALSKELEAIELYRKFSVDYPVAKDAFLFLIEEEEKHQRMIEKKINELIK